MVMPSQSADIKAAATHLLCYLVAATGLVVVAVGAFHPERHLGAVGLTCLLLGGVPLVMDRHRRLVCQDRAAAHERFLRLEEEERERTKRYCETQLAELERRKRALRDDIDNYLTKIKAEEFTRAWSMLASGELTGSGSVRRLPPPQERCHDIPANSSSVTDSGGHHYPL